MQSAVVDFILGLASEYEWVTLDLSAVGGTVEVEGFGLHTTRIGKGAVISLVPAFMTEAVSPREELGLIIEPPKEKTRRSPTINAPFKLPNNPNPENPGQPFNALKPDSAPVRSKNLIEASAVIRDTVVPVIVLGYFKTDDVEIPNIRIRLKSQINQGVFWIRMEDIILDDRPKVEDFLNSSPDFLVNRPFSGNTDIPGGTASRLVDAPLAIPKEVNHYREESLARYKR